MQTDENRIGEQEGDLLAQEKFECVTLVLYDDPNKRRFVRCLYCGKKLFVAHGKGIEVMFEGRHLEAKEAIDIFCDRCRVVYRLVNNTLATGTQEVL